MEPCQDTGGWGKWKKGLPLPLLIAPTNVAILAPFANVSVLCPPPAGWSVGEALPGERPLGAPLAF